MRLIDADRLIKQLEAAEAREKGRKNEDLANAFAAVRIYVEGLPTEDRWYRRDEREPTEADCDSAKCLVAVHRYNGIMVTHIANYFNNKLFTHWRPAAALPEDAGEVKSEERTVKRE